MNTILDYVKIAIFSDNLNINKKGAVRQEIIC